MRRLLGDRTTRYYIAGTTISAIGDNALWLTLSIWVKVLTGSTSAAGLSIFMLTLGSLGSPLSGLLVDRFSRVRLLIVTDLATCALVACLLAVRSEHQLWLIYLVMFGYGISASLIGSAQTALVQTIVVEDLLADANSLTQALTQGSRIVVPLLCAGLFAAFGATPVIIGDCVTFLIAVLVLSLLRVSEPVLTPSAGHWLRQVAAGAEHLWRTRLLRLASASCVLAVIAFGLSETVIYAVLSDGLHRSPPFLGVLTSGQGAGAIAAGLFGGVLSRRLGEQRLMVAGLILAGLSFGCQAVPNLAVVLTGLVLFGGSLSLLLVGMITLLQRQTPPALMGRADAALNFLITVPQTLAIGLGAALVVVLDYRLLLLGMAMLCLAGGGLLLGQRKPALVDATVG
ncbi:MAG TPA: MFS transporter [Jatrophihabitans sp.]|nr:MFS transporter [Jatrophihabitans sp.]